MYSQEIRALAIRLREEGLRYPEIIEKIGTAIPKGTLAYWFRNIKLQPEAQFILHQKNLLQLKEARKLAVLIGKERRAKHFNELILQNSGLLKVMKDKETLKALLVIFYLGEGTKKINGGDVCFGNSDPLVVKFYLTLLRRCYNIDESKFRCTVQCRADQNIRFLENYWSSVTGIPSAQFYKTRIDPRTIGKVTKKKKYKGVCRIEYFSSEVLLDLLAAIKVIVQGPVA